MTLRIFRRLAPFCFCVLFLASSAAQSLAATRKHPPAKPINLNTATAAQLEQLPGVGPATAKAILDFRAKSGPFRRVEDLLSVHGISEKRLQKLRPYVTVAPASSVSQKPRPRPINLK